MIAAQQQRCRELVGWVKEALHGLGVAARPLPVLATWDVATYKQAVLFEGRDVERSERAELQDKVLRAVQEALWEGIEGVRAHAGDPSFGWSVVGARDLSGHESWEPSMPKYACFIEWKGPKPATWPNQVHMGRAPSGLSYPVGVKPSWN